MISVEEALQQVLQHQPELGTEHVPLLQATGRVLAQQVLADRDFPPYNRVTMDGIAVQLQALENGKRFFKIEGIQPAGHPQLTLQEPDNCLEVMTGAVLPEQTDVVVPYEQCTIAAGTATVNLESFSHLQNVHLQGSDEKAGAVLLQKGLKITPAVVGTLASVGIADVAVYRLPRVAICSTGDELVPIAATPAAHQVRRSNVYTLAAALATEDIQPQLLHLPDHPAEMETQLAGILQQVDVLLLSGAVSKGKYDYLPEVLEKLGVEQVFHRVAQKPGKPLLFGRYKSQALVFGFPGNPVSTFVCYQVFFRPWLYQAIGYTPAALTAVLAQDITFKPPLTYHLLVTLSSADGVLYATPLSNSGSGDLLSLVQADALLSLPAGEETFRAGVAYQIILLRQV